MSELVSEFMPDDLINCVESSGGKAKIGIMGIGFWRLAGWELERRNDPICLFIVAEKMIFLRLKGGGTWLFNDLFIFIFTLGVLCYYMSLYHLMGLCMLLGLKLSFFWEVCDC